MKKQAFTLIELLVVVLIIGILAAIALPQYQKAMWKAKFTQAKVFARALADAEEVFWMANGSYTSDLTKLGITEMQGCSVGERGQVDCYLYKNGKRFMRYTIFLQHPTEDVSTRWIGNSYCFAFCSESECTVQNTDLSYQMCQNETGKSAPVNGWTGVAVGFLY